VPEKLYLSVRRAALSSPTTDYVSSSQALIYHPLSLVDLPGFFHSGGESQTDADAEFVQDLVRRYMRGSNTIILAVVSAKSDPATQIVLKYVAEEDLKG